MEFTFKRAEEEDRDPSNNGTFITVAGCWHSMIVVGIVAHTQEFFDKRLNFHQMAYKRHLLCDTIGSCFQK